jgi:hypothetical protein
MVVTIQTGLLGLLCKALCYCDELVLVFEFVLALAGLLAGLLALLSVLLLPGVVAPPWLLVLGVLVTVLLLVLPVWSLPPVLVFGLQPTRANAAPQMRIAFFISIFL